tara:strand:+ start:182 stop:907 length:726 start_codon:yes stop_codon:yes gene_type:complete
MRNALFLNEKNFDKSVYRIISESRLFELFDTQKNVLVRPSMWEDPFENFILNSTVRTGDGELGGFGFRDDLFGQCWTFQKASDAMWRIYSSDKRGVRIRSTPRKLLASLSAGLGEWATSQAFVGKVRYLPDAKMRKFARDVFRGGLDVETVVSTLLVKRPAFAHEREMRIVYFDRAKSKTDLYSYNLDAHQLIDQMMTDPRLTADETGEFQELIRSKTKFQGNILRSLLYAPPSGFEVRLP